MGLSLSQVVRYNSAGGKAVAAETRTVLPDVPVRFTNRDELNRLMDEIEEQMGFVPVPDITIEKLREMMEAEGIRPEENALSRDIIRMRDGEDA
jgi:hypothetical protein